MAEKLEQKDWYPRGIDYDYEKNELGIKPFLRYVASIPSKVASGVVDAYNAIAFSAAQYFDDIMCVRGK